MFLQSILALGSGKKPTEWVLWTLSWEYDQGMKLTTHPHLVLRLIASGAIPPLHHIPSWCAHRQLGPSFTLCSSNIANNNGIQYPYSSLILLQKTYGGKFKISQTPNVNGLIQALAYVDYIHLSEKT
jgi:hypothetical protein